MLSARRLAFRESPVAGGAFFLFSTSVTMVSETVLKAAVLGLLLLAGVTVVASPPQEQKTVLAEDYFPDGQGRDLIFQACVQCHDLGTTVTQRKNAAAWKRTVDEMIWRGAPLMTDEAQIVTKYLAASFGPDKPIPDELKSKPAGNKR